MLPKSHHGPARFSQNPPHLPVPRFVRGKFPHPKSPVPLRQRPMFRTTVPEAAVDEDSQFTVYGLRFTVPNSRFGRSRAKTRRRKGFFDRIDKIAATVQRILSSFDPLLLRPSLSGLLIPVSCLLSSPGGRPLSGSPLSACFQCSMFDVECSAFVPALRVPVPAAPDPRHHRAALSR